MSKSEGESRGHRHTFSKKICLITTAVILVLATSLGVGLGIGLSGGSGSNSSSPTPSSTPSLSPPSNTTGAFWQPPAGTSWQIVLQTPLSDTSLDVSVYDVDLFDNPASTFDLLHASSKRVICYFSAGSYEPNRPDSANFTDDDKGTELDGWPGEYWLDTTSLNVRSIMTARIALAARKGCDGSKFLTSLHHVTVTFLPQQSILQYLVKTNTRDYQLTLTILMDMTMTTVSP